MSGRVDSHQHFWKLALGFYPWPTPDEAAIYRDCMPSDLAPLLQENGIDRTVLIQAAPNAEETVFMLQLAEDVPFVAGVVGWIDLMAPDAPEQIKVLAANPYAVGVRAMLQDLTDVGWIFSPAATASLHKLASAGLALDVLVRPVHLPAIADLLKRHPDLAVVVDHAAKPDIGRGGFRPWADLMAEVARFPNAVCKLSGLLTEAPGHHERQCVRPYVEHVLDHFGAERVMWGSDWPVIEMVSDYGSWTRICMEILSDLSAREITEIMGGVAHRVYGLRG